MKKFLRIIYSNIPLKKYLFYILRNNFKIRENFYKHLWFEGFFSTNYLNKQFFIYSLPTIIENEIFWNGLGKTWEPLSIRIWTELLKKKKIVFDIGANTGIYSLLSCAFNRKASIYAFEPNPNFIKAILKAKNKNKFNIKVNDFALSNKNGTVHFDGYQIKKKQNLNKIKTIRLDNFIENNKIQSIDLIKLDVELHEVHVVKGMGKYLKKYRPDFLIEVLDNNIAKKLNYLFKNLGYNYVSIDDKKIKLKKLERIEKSPFYNVLICKKETYEIIKKKFNKLF